MRTGNSRVKISFNSPVILSFTILCLVSLLLGTVTKGMTTDLFFSVYRSSLMSPAAYIRFAGHVLGHAGWDHFLGNIMLILVVGPLLEEKYGSSNMLFVILATAGTASRSQRCRICADFVVILYKPQGRIHSIDVYTGGIDLYRRTGLSGDLRTG